jgi:hypothetical protein
VTTTTKISSGDSAAASSAARVPALLGCSAGGTVNQTYAFSPGDDVASVLKGGPLADAVYTLLRNTGGTVLATPATPTWSAAPSIVHTDKTGGSSPTGPTVTCALAAGASGCFDDHTILITPTSDGAGGVAQATVAYDGVTAIETIVIPAEPPAVLRGTVDLAALSYPYSGLATKHLDFTAPASKTITFGTGYTSAQAIADDFNALAAAAPLAVRARLAQDVAGHAYFELYSTAGGASITATIDATASDADTVLGFSSGANNLTATGAAATLTMPFTGLVFTFPSGSYVKGEGYRAACVGPRASISALIAAASATRDQYANNPFGFFAVAQASDTAPNCAALQSALATITKDCIANPTSPIYITQVIGSPLHVASPTRATNDASIATTDAALLSAFGSAAKNFDSVAVGDIYTPGSTELRFGQFRRTAALAWAIQRANAPKLAADVAEGVVPDASLLAPDGRTRARDDATATTHLGRGNGPGFSALRSTSAGLGSPKFLPGATRAGSSSRLRYVGAYAICLEAARIIFGASDAWEGQTPPTNPITGMLRDDEKEQRANQLTAVLLPVLQPDKGPPNVSSFSVSILDPDTGRFMDNGDVVIEFRFVPLGEIEDVVVRITAVGTIIA